MTVEQLIKELEKFDKNMEVQFDFEQHLTLYIDGVEEATEDYGDETEKIVVIY